MEIISSRNFNTLEAVQKFIDDNPEEFRTANDVAKKQPKIYGKMGRMGWRSKVKYPDPPKKTSLAMYNTFDDFQKVANNYNTPAEFVRENKTISDRFFKLRSRGLIENKDLYFPGRKPPYGDTFTKAEHFQEYIDKNGIESPKDFLRKNSALYKRLTTLGFTDKVKYKHKKRKPLDFSTNYNTIEQIQDFVIKYKISSNVDFNKRASAIYRKYLKLRKETGKFIIYPSSSKIASSEEEWSAILELLKYNIKYEYQYKFTGYEYRYDFYLPDYNIILEINGGQHYNINAFPEHWDTKSGESTIDRDKRKYNIAVKNGISIYYITYDGRAWKDYLRFGYFKEVYRSIEELFSFLGIELVDDGKQTKRFLEMYPDNIISIINRVIQEFEITIDKLPEYPNLKEIIELGNLWNKLEFCSSFGFIDYNEDVND